jgi:hypothetical protein
VAYIDQTYVDAFITADVRTKLYTDNAVYQTAAFNQHIATAEAEVNGVLKALGHSVPLTGTIGEDIKAATFGQFVPLAYQRKQLKPPENFATEIAMLEQIRLGNHHPVGLTPSEESGIGGVKASENDATVTESFPQVFVSWFRRVVP